MCHRNKVHFLFPLFQSNPKGGRVFDWGTIRSSLFMVSAPYSFLVSFSYQRELPCNQILGEGYCFKGSSWYSVTLQAFLLGLSEYLKSLYFLQTRQVLPGILDVYMNTTNPSENEGKNVYVDQIVKIVILEWTRKLRNTTKHTWFLLNPKTDNKIEK